MLLDPLFLPPFNMNVYGELSKYLDVELAAVSEKNNPVFLTVL